MKFQSLVHAGLDLTLLAMVLAALRQNTGYVFAFEQTGMGNYVHKIMSWGEWCYAKFVNYAVKSQHFRKQLPGDGFTTLSLKEVEEISRSSRKAHGN